jgi:CHASE3 domain sensor protein
MKWSLEGKLAAGLMCLLFLLLGLFRMLSWHNATDLLELSQQIQQSEVTMQTVIQGVSAIGAAMTDAEAERVNYL